MSSFIKYSNPCLPCKQGFSQLGIQAPFGRPLFKEYCFVFQMLLHKLLIWAGPIVQFGRPLFESWLKTCLQTGSLVECPFGYFTLGRFVLSPSSCDQTLPTGACLQGNPTHGRPFLHKNKSMKILCNQFPNRQHTVLWTTVLCFQFCFENLCWFVT